jgi:DNA-binding NtrC family response regulator
VSEAKRTLPYPEEGTTAPVQTLRVQVLDGPHAGTEVEAEDELLQIGAAEGNDLVLDDPTVSRFHVALSRHDDGIVVEDPGSTNGTFVGDLRVERALVPVGTVLRVGRTAIRVVGGRTVELGLDGAELGSLRGRAPAVQKLFARVRKAAQSQVSVLLVGESGTGKELIARALHDEGSRADGPFVVVDCASLTPTLVASELFGHERGAFTGADHQHIGAFERAHGGTVFLDEIGELPEQLQPTLLGVLERRKFRRLGGRKEIAIDVRVVCATHRDLRAEVNAGSFRLDLFYRLAVVRLSVPPLRERREDIPLLAAHFAREMGEAQDLSRLIPPDELARIQRHHWPGNVRELRNYVEARLAMGEPVPLEELEGIAAEEAGGRAIALEPLLTASYKEARATLLRQFESHYLPHILDRAGGNVSQAARDCRMDRSHLWELLRRHQLR